MNVAASSLQDERALVFECDDVSVDFPHQGGTRQVLSGIGFELREGEFLSIVGTSGAGKTTLLRVLGGLLGPTSGAVRVRGKKIDGPPDDVVMVFQDYSRALLQWRTVTSNVALGIEDRMGKDECNQRVMEVLQLVGMEKYASYYPWQISGGMQQRVQIARALALQPAVMLMDEPFGALDAMTKSMLQDELLRVRDKIGASFVFITHDIDEAVYLSDRVAILTGTPGRIGQTMDVPLPRPRDQITTRADPRFLNLRHVIHEAVKEARHD
ncbi:MAG: transporter related protein [Herminiimonas sp.]|nr:transporter related protein [Herminiimonas sp.]MDB5855793.1 transporter related protein [Herminiimonas sp.]